MPPRVKNLRKSPKIADSAAFGTEKEPKSALVRKGRTFYEQVGHDAMVEMLVESGSKQALQLAEMLQDPRYSPESSNFSFFSLCDRSGLTLKDVAHLYEQHQGIVAKVRLMKHIPEVLEDVAIDAKSKDLPCVYCLGTGKALQQDRSTGEFVPTGFPCPECKGQGSTRQIGDKDARALVFETAGFTRKGPLIDQRSVTINASDGQALASLVRKTALILEAAPDKENE